MSGDDRPLWAGRFGRPPAPEAAALGRSLGFDVRLARQDAEASVAHVRGLRDAGLLDAEEAARLEEAVRSVAGEIAEGRFAFHPADEDVHSAIERAVTERLGPLGAGALATSTLGLDPAAAARRLGFDRAFENSIDAVSSRDAVQELLACCAIAGTDLSRLAAALLRWTELGWAELDEADATGSSMMPQKRNPDV
ncbi:MAG TPA: lyase family protein, partial [Actinomycetota bacterium]|nr:lyase family protein [Actinomycetota bacterium]